MLLGLVWVSPMMSLLLHVTCSCIHYFPSFFSELVLCFCCFFLSVSNRTSLWHPNRRNPLRLGTFIMVLSHPFLLFLLFHLTSDSVMKRPRRTSLRTSKAVVFIRNTRLFYQILPTLLYQKSFELKIVNLYLRDPRGVPSCL